MKSLARVSSLVFVILTVACLVITSCGGGSGGIMGANVTLTRVTFGIEGDPLVQGRIKIPFNSDLTARKFINVVVDLNKDGVYSNYTVNGSVQQEWIVRDSSAAVMRSEPNNFSFAFYDIDADSRKAMTGYAVLTDNPFSSAAWDGTPPTSTVASVDFVINSVATETRSYTLVAGIESETGFGGMANTAPPVEGVGPRLLAAESFDSFHAGVPDIQQRYNECVPTSAANNLRWLADKHGYSDRLPSNADMISELKTNMDWHRDRGVVSKTEFIPGKTKFCQDHNLPIETHQIGSERGRDLPKLIDEEMRKGQAIEVVISFWLKKADGTWERRGGHMVTGVGTHTAGDSTFLDFHDPDTTSLLDIYKVSDTEFVDSLTLPNYAPGYSTIIERAFAQSPTEITPTECSALADLLISMNSTSINDPSQHKQFTGNPIDGNQLQFSINSGILTVSGGAPFVQVSGPVADGCSFSASGSGNVAGYSGIAVSMDGSVSDNTLTGSYSMGSEGGLPGGNPITFNFSGNL